MDQAHSSGNLIFSHAIAEAISEEELSRAQEILSRVNSGKIHIVSKVGDDSTPLIHLWLKN